MVICDFIFIISTFPIMSQFFLGVKEESCRSVAPLAPPLGSQVCPEATRCVRLSQSSVSRGTASIWSFSLQKAGFVEVHSAGGRPNKHGGGFDHQSQTNLNTPRVRFLLHASFGQVVQGYPLFETEFHDTSTDVDRSLT